MTKVAITKSLLDDLAASISAKTGETLPLTIAEMTDAVDDITLPSGSVGISTNGSHNVAAYASADVSVPTGTSRDSSDLMVSGDTVTVPAGLYGSNATKAVASGTAGTPVATKGTVSNNSVTVTPSVTNTAGYISGGTKTGTAVTVTASELISFSTIRTGSSAPSSSLGVDGDIYIQTS